MLKEYSDKSTSNKTQKEAIDFVKQKLDSAKWFIDAIKQRQNTLYVVMAEILSAQRDYFLTGDEGKIKPLILKDIADKVNLDVSTISRVASNKYVQTPYGTFILKNFFSESMQNEAGEEISTREVKSYLKDLINEESKSNPLSDEALCELLKEKGFNLSRRTITKYRELLNIPVARLRKQI